MRPVVRVGVLVLVVLALGVACEERQRAGPPPIGPGTSTPGTASVGVSTGDASTSTSTSSSSGSTTETSTSDTDAPVETGSDTPCGDWAEVYVGCLGEGMVADFEQQCEAELVSWDELLPSCRVLAEEVLACITQLPCQALLDWEINRAIPMECAAEIEALEQMCSFVGTTGG